MTKSGFLCALAAIALVGCGPRVAPPRGVGFDDFSQYELERARRESALSGQTLRQLVLGRVFRPFSPRFLEKRAAQRLLALRCAARFPL